MIDAYLLLGSNLGERENHLNGAAKLIDFRCGKVIQKSSMYETAAWGKTDQQSFYNQALQIKTSLSPTDLLSTLKTIEKEIGRTQHVKWGPRVIDIDILLYGDRIVDLPDLKIPHPYMTQRRFTLTPLNEIAGKTTHPVCEKSIEELLGLCDDSSAVYVLTT